MIFSATVLIDGKECLEYRKLTDDFDFPPTTSFYVESVKGASFTVIAHLTNVSAMSPLRKKQIRCRLYVDGVKMDAKDSKKENSSHHSFKFTGMRTSLMEKRSFVFADTSSEIQGDGSSSCEGDGSGASKCIRIEFYSGTSKKINKIQKNAVMGYQAYKDHLCTPIKNGSKVSRFGSGCTLGPLSVSPINKATFGLTKFTYDDRDEPFGVISINYRSKIELEAMGVRVEDECAALPSMKRPAPSSPFSAVENGFSSIHTLKRDANFDSHL
jgi:hypothetical protein